MTCLPIRPALLLALLIACVGSGAAASPAPKLWYDAPAKTWNEALPVGCGRLGAMVFGGAAGERIQFNEDTLWTGKPHDYSHLGAAGHLAEIRALVNAGKNAQAADVLREEFLSLPVRQRAYQPFGDLHLSFAGHENATDYRRELDLLDGVARVSYQVGGTTFRREIFASYPDQAIILRITADHPGSISFTLDLDTPHRMARVAAIGNDILQLTGQVQDPARYQYDQKTFKPEKPVDLVTVQTDGLKFEARVKVIPDRGRIAIQKTSLVVEGADAATVILVAATSFVNFRDISADPAARCQAALDQAAAKPFAALLAAHQMDHRDLFTRVSLDLGGYEKDSLATDERLKRVKTDGLVVDPGLAALHFQYGRYLLIASSRPGSQPATLQGVWNELLDPPWESKYTTNINLEMNYWPAEVTNLSACAEPLFDFINDLRVSGHVVAQTHYAARGWVVHHNSDLWRGAAPINNIDGQWPTGGAWLCNHLWEHYLFTGDTDFLARRAYPAMKEACEFFLDYLVKDEQTGWLISSPSFSPEQGTLCAGPAMDHQLIRALFDATVAAAATLGIDSEFAAQVSAARRRLAPDRIGQYGQLQEWLADIDKPNNKHRHMSPLWCLYPGAQYTAMDQDPRTFNAAKVLLQWRGDGSTGWSYAWRLPMWARAGDGEVAFRQLDGLLSRRTLPNLFDLCGPFQIDGNFGATAGIAELLLQSHARAPQSGATVIQLLPALPKAWPSGSVSGLCARGGFEVDLSWKAGILTNAVIRSKLGRPCAVSYAGRSITLATQRGTTYRLDFKLNVAPGETQNQN